MSAWKGEFYQVAGKVDSDEACLLALGGPPFDDTDSDTNSNEVNAQTPNSATSTLSRPPSADFDPSTLGFGHFFAYAAAYWTDHSSDVTPERRPDTHQLATLCQKRLPTPGELGTTVEKAQLRSHSRIRLPRLRLRSRPRGDGPRSNRATRIRICPRSGRTSSRLSLPSRHF